MTNTERLIRQLIEDEEPFDSTLWNHPTLLTNLKVITAPLTSLPCVDYSAMALKLNEVHFIICFFFKLSMIFTESFDVLFN